MSEKVSLILSRCARTLRFVIGAPDYERYLDHIRAHHPNEEPLTRNEFANQRLTDRYARPGARCC